MHLERGIKAPKPVLVQKVKHYRITSAYAGINRHSQTERVNRMKTLLNLQIDLAIEI